MTKQELIDIIKENVEINITETAEMYSDKLVITLSIDGEIFFEDSYTLETNYK